MKELKKIYNKISKQTQNRLQEIFSTFNFTCENLYNIADDTTKRKINSYIEEWKDKDLLEGYFGLLAKNIYNRLRVNNYEILELLIYSAYIEEQSKLKEKEMKIFKELANYYYKLGQDEVDENLKKKKEVSVIPGAIFLALLNQPNVKGLTYEKYTEITIRYYSEQILKQVIIDFQQQKTPDINNEIYQNIIERQQRAKLNINNDKISGDIDVITTQLDNNAKCEGIYSFDKEAEVRFISVHDQITTKMCRSLDNQKFKVHDWNIFKRYSQTNGTIKNYKCYGLIPGLNLPPISDNFHYCRSYIKYVAR